ncbi:MAG TPA: indole-3-glycerol phosphate synthase TrpC [Alphaproteobacteria bacterium]|nr:indole-3-glycerol phosphate synthase TrpC [Alphaproteobacteria bacterium]
MNDVLAEIVAVKAKHVAAQRAHRSQGAVESLADAAGPPRGFADALKRTAASHFALITEMKRRSPSGGEIRPGFDPAAVARDYLEAGAACLSVLTDGPYFGGVDSDLEAARAAVPLPALRKDFIVDPYQIAESRALGADCILLIVATLDDALLSELAAEAARFGMDVLIEVHDEAELERALMLDAGMIGINNRNLKTLKTDIATFERLAPRVPTDRLLVAESGLKTTADLRRMAEARATAFLVGESLLRQPDLVSATRALIG